MLVLPDFLTQEACARFRAGMAAAGSEPADVLVEGIEDGVDGILLQPHMRHADQVEMSDAMVEEAERALEAARGPAERHFGVPLDHREGPGFLRYGPGGFYRPHRDRADVPAWPAAARRAVSLVLFLNSAADSLTPGDFTGGRLRLYVEDAADGPMTIVTPRAGTLVMFPATLLHDVEPVGAGTRMVIVDWFYSV